MIDNTTILMAQQFLCLSCVGVHKWGVPQNGRFIVENPIKMDDAGVLLFQETSMWGWFKTYSYCIRG